MALDEGKIARDALTQWSAETSGTLLDFAKSYPEVFRRGVTAFLEDKPEDGRARRQERSLLDALANRDPAAYASEVERRIAATSFQEVLDLLTSGRQPRR